MVGVLNTMKERRALYAQEMAYVREAVFEDAIDDRMEMVDKSLYTERRNDYKEAAELLEKMTVESCIADEAKEVQRIMEATEDMTFEQMIGIE